MNENVAAELYEVFNGINIISGEKGVGKTSMALGFPCDPTRIAFFNFDEKPLGGIESRLLFYRNYFPILADLEGNIKAENKMLLEFFSDTAKLIEKKEKPSLVIIDSVERLLSAFLPYTIKNSGQMKEFMGAGVWAQRSKIGYAKVYSTAFFSKLRESLQCPIILIAHLGDKYVENIAIGKEPMLNEVLRQKALFSIWLMHNDSSPVPNGLVMKRIDKKSFTPTGIRQTSVLPPKINHEALPEYDKMDSVSVWDIIAHYWENPSGLRELKDYEKLTDEEFALVSDSLTETQKNQLAVASKAGSLSEADEMIVEQIVQENINKPLPVIFARVKEAFDDGTNISKAIVQEIVDRNK